jgi:hypothetical protein
MWVGMDVLTRIFGGTHYDFNSDQLVFEGPKQ